MIIIINTPNMLVVVTCNHTFNLNPIDMYLVTI